MDPDQTAPIGVVCSGSTLFASILNSSEMLGKYLQQTTSTGDIFRYFFSWGFKGIEFIDLHSIFKDNSVISSIPNYFNNSETPIICYKYNKPIRSTIFNFNKIVNDLDIGSNTPAS